jgi:mycofactocin precursor
MSDVQPSTNVAEAEPEHRPETPEPTPEPAALIEAELLVEEVSIDGMCGVY